MKPFLAIATLSLLASPAAAKTDYPPDPETVVCPPARGDLDYAIDRIMTAGKFQQDPSGGPYSWRRREDGPFHLLSAEPAQWVRVEFKQFDTAAGTRIVAELRWQTSSYEFGVKQREPYAAIQEMLDGLQAVYPCDSSSAPAAK